ncbi:MAG: heavy-metal-associated domain-containing protein [Saprospiraceae bacterium]|nr:heavy-metal-associated domain-containing protein [Candidatus Vicinibacter proximus]MBL7823515.1 heavy-metal-associated domain-containing protein [Saprospiraceae bacterium]MCC6842731.1 heavy-metal-associated domain-containing protein [Saprospiraceae bacterium]
MNIVIKSIIVVFFTLFTTQIGTAQIENFQILLFKVHGNCGMCKKTIEKAGNVKGVSKTEWNVETKVATITIDTTKISFGEILQRIANAGYDNDKFRAPDAIYGKLPACCQYPRLSKNE